MRPSPSRSCLGPAGPDTGAQSTQPLRSQLRPEVRKRPHDARRVLRRRPVDIARFENVRRFVAGGAIVEHRVAAERDAAPTRSSLAPTCRCLRLILRQPGRELSKVDQSTPCSALLLTTIALRIGRHEPSDHWTRRRLGASAPLSAAASGAQTQEHVLTAPAAVAPPSLAPPDRVEISAAVRHLAELYGPYVSAPPGLSPEHIRELTERRGVGSPLPDRGPAARSEMAP